MITFLEGVLENKELSAIVLNVNGVGYSILIPLSCYEILPEEGNTCRLLTYHHITESDEKLFGFKDNDERAFFTQLLTISGIGPKLAITAISGLPVEEFKRAISNGDISLISSISGIGKKTAERIIVEMKGIYNTLESLKIKDSNSSDSRINDAVLALNSLGYNPDTSAKMVKSVINKLTPATTVEEIIRLTLKK